MDIAVDIATILFLILLNGLLALGELSLISSNRARLAVLERKGVAGAALARRMAEDPQQFLPTAQVGITLVGILSGVFGGARLEAGLTPFFEGLPQIGRFASTISLTLVVIAITYLTMVLGELVPKQLALRHPERVAAVAAPILALLARITMPVVWVLGKSSALVLRLFRAHTGEAQTVTEEEL